jgi:hypothetical protein
MHEIKIPTGRLRFPGENWSAKDFSQVSAGEDIRVVVKKLGQSKVVDRYLYNRCSLTRTRDPGPCKADVSYIR